MRGNCVLKSYKEKQRSFNCQIDDTVTVFKIPDDQEMQQWGIPWTSEMNRCVGRVGKVMNIESSGILARIPGVIGPEYQMGCWYFPYTSLKLVR
jgi:hypothetical protein